MANTTQDARSGRGRLGVTAGIALVGCGVLLFGVGLLVGMAIGVQRAERAAQGSPEVSAQGNETRGPTASEASVETAPKTSITREQRERVDALFASIDKFATNEFAANEEKMGNIQNLVDIAKTGEPAVAEYIFQRASAIVRDLSKPINQRWMTCYVLSGSGDARAVDVLAQVLERDPEGMVRGVAACALGYFASAEARAVLEEAARREVSPGVQADIRRSLERLAQQGVGASVRFEERDSHSAPALALPYEETEVRKLPWPHQAPGLSESEIEQLNQTVWVINDFPLYQSDDAGAFRYFHGGLDIVLPNGTPVYAMKDGWVKGVSQGSVKIADARDGTPCYGWEYSHLGNIRVGVGDFVERGTCIGEVQFDGLEHIHLGKAFSQDPYWDSWHYFCAPNAHFTYADRAPPVIASISFFQNNADSRFEPDASGNATVRGEVDIVVGIRDPGEFAHSRDSGYGDRLSAARIDYAIRRKGGPASQAREFRSFDFTTFAMKKAVMDKVFNTDATKVVYKHWALFENTRRDGNRSLSYYVITNCPGDAPPREINPADQAHSWQTAAYDEQGRAEFPDGEYEIVVTAYDFAGNRAEQSASVTVANGY